MKVLLDHYPYRFCENDAGDEGWIEKFNYTTKRYSKMYECQSSLQMLTAMEDIEYVKWLDPEGVPCYRRQRGNSIRKPHN